MPARILKADSIVVSLSKSMSSAKGDNPKAALQADTVDDKESQMAIAEAKLTIFKLLNDAKRQAEEIIDQAKEQAKQILEQAAAESAGMEEARESGYQSGRADEQTGPAERPPEVERGAGSARRGDQARKVTHDQGA